MSKEGIVVGVALVVALLFLCLLFWPSIKWPRGRKRGDPEKEVQRRKELVKPEKWRQNEEKK